MKLVVVLAVLCASVLADNDRRQILDSIDGSISDIQDALQTATTTLTKTVAMKLNLKRECWKRITDNVATSSPAVQKMETLRTYLTSLLKEMQATSETTEYEKIVLTGPNTIISQIVNTGAQLANALMDVINKLNVNTQC
ncbi:hypothetical protein GE061_003113 [Apolygus lucorum]|uniref:Uncharacterized protein n=1 Tax=Apolygus lucorum TaxID=248454 RepID=A0A6A4JSX3_APOLU|nr:hypothetical protein GE061_003113 [Apolygus lucorum]